MTEENLQKAIGYVIMKMKEANVNPMDMGEVLRFMIENPLPTKVEYEAELAAAEAAAKAARILALQTELAQLQS
jgi:hypothetical protein